MTSNPNELHQKMQQMSTEKNVYSIDDTAKSARSQFPVVLGNVDPRDETYGLRKQIVGKDGVVDGVGLAVADSSYFDYVKDKDRVAQSMAFKSYLMNQADLSTPEAQQYWFDKFPWMRDERLAYIDRISELQRKEAYIQLNGPQTEDDFLFLYMKDQGLITIPEKVVSKLTSNNESFTDGIFSVMSKFFPKQTEAKKVDWKDPMGSTTAINTNPKWVPNVSGLLGPK